MNSDALSNGETVANPATPRPWMTERASAALLVCLGAVLLIWANFDKRFYNFDDPGHIKESLELPMSSLLMPFDTSYTYMPVSRLSLLCDVWLFKPKDESSRNAPATVDDGQSNRYYFGMTNWAPPLRIESALFHALAGYLLWCLLRRLKVGSGVALLVAFVWTAHPVACESVCWISERKNVLVALFGFGALLAQTARGNRWRWPLATFLYLMATLSKPTGVGIFPVMVLLELLLEKQSKDTGNTRPTSWARVTAGLAAPLLVTAFIVKVNVGIHQNVFVAHPGGSVFSAMLTDAEIFARYMFNTILPVNLSFFYAVDPIRSLADPRFWLYGAAVLAFCGAMLWAADKESRPVAAFGILWFFAALGPNSNIAPIPYWMQDRYAYLSVAGFVLAFVLAVKGLLARLKIEKWTKAAACAFAVLIALLSVARASVYKDAYTLIDDAAARQPLSGMAHLQAGNNAKYFFNGTADPALHHLPGQRADAERALTEWLRATNCQDIGNFYSVYQLRIQCAELEMQLGRPDDARAHLNDWLPPKTLRPADPAKPFMPTDMPYFYTRDMLAHAWLIMADARLRKAQTLDRFTVPVAERIAATNDALIEVNHSIEASVWNYQGYFLKAKILLFLTILDDEKKDEVAFAKHVDEAIRLLRQVPATSDCGAEAAALLSQIKTH